MGDWNRLDKFIAKIRYHYVAPYIKDGMVVADVGCGRDGAFLKHYKDRISIGYGYDFRVEDKKEENLYFINNKNCPNGIPDIPEKKCDVVFMNAVLEHLSYPPVSMLNRLMAMLKKGGGYLVMTTPTPAAKYILEFLAYKLHVINEEEIREHQHYYDKKDIVNLCNKLECKVVIQKYKYFELGLNSIIVIKKIE